MSVFLKATIRVVPSYLNKTIIKESVLMLIFKLERKSYLG